MPQGWDYMVRKFDWATEEAKLISFLEQVGPDGWELVAVLPTGPATPDTHYVYFKRARVSPQDVFDVDVLPS